MPTLESTRSVPVIYSDTCRKMASELGFLRMLRVRSSCAFRGVLHSLAIALPTRVASVKDMREIVIETGPDAFSALIDDLYRDYLLNVKADRFRIAVILAGAITEVILYQLPLEQDVNPKILSGDRNLGLGKMLDYARLRKRSNRSKPIAKWFSGRI